MGEPVYLLKTKYLEISWWPSSTSCWTIDKTMTCWSLGRLFVDFMPYKRGE